MSGKQRIRGEVGIWTIDEHTGQWELLGRQANTTLIDYGYIAAMCIGRGDPSYRVQTMYFEFENVASPGDAVTAPAYDEFSGISYYNSLSASPSRDFVRSTIIGQPGIDVISGHEAYFAAGEGNQLVFYAQTSGTTGVHGKTFSDSVNSKVFGAALAASPVAGDRTGDKIFARTYFATANQTLKTASAQIGFTWNIPFPV